MEITSTIPQATIVACQTLGRVDFLLLGGFDRDIDYRPLVEYMVDHPVPHLLLSPAASSYDQYKNFGICISSKLILN